MREFKLRPINLPTETEQKSSDFNLKPINVDELPISSTQQTSKEKSIIEDEIPKVNLQIKAIDELGFLEGYNDDEKKYLKNIVLSDNYSPEQKKEAISTVGGNHEKQGGFQTWYKDPKTELPVPLAPGQKAPEGSRIESVWGSQQDEESIGATIGKNLANAVPQFIGSLESVGALAQTMVTGKEPQWYKEAKTRLETYEAPTSVKSQEAIFNSKGMDSISDLFDSERYTVTPDNVVGTISQGVSSIAQFIAANALTGGIGATATAGKVATYGKQLAAGITINMSEALDMADEAGLKDRDKFGFASLVSLPVSIVEMNMGLGSTILERFGAKETANIAKEVAKNVVYDAEGKLTKQSIKSMYNEAMAQSAGLVAKYGKNIVKEAASEGSEEALQSVIRNGGAEIYDKLFAKDKEVGKGKFGTETFSPEEFGNYLNDAIGGALTGGLGAGAKREKQSRMAFDEVEKDGGASLRTQIKNAVNDKTMTEDDAQKAYLKINGYRSYQDELKKSNVELDKPSKKRLFELSYGIESVRSQIEMLSKEKGTVTESLLNNAKQEESRMVKERDELLKKDFAKQQFATSTKTQEEIKNQPQPVEPKPTSKISFKSEKFGGELLNQVKNATTENELDAYLDEADKKGLINQSFMDVLSKRREEIKASKSKLTFKAPEKNESETTNPTVTTELGQTSEVNQSNTTETKTDVSLEQPDVKLLNREGAASKALGKEVKQASVDEVTEKLNTLPEKISPAKVFNLGKLHNDKHAVEVKINGVSKFVPIASSSTVGTYGLSVAEKAGQRVNLKLIPKDEWNPDNKFKDKSGKPYGDKVEVWSLDVKEPKLLGHLEVTDFTKKEIAPTSVEKTVADSKVSEKKPTVSTFEERKKEIEKRRKEELEFTFGTNVEVVSSGKLAVIDRNVYFTPKYPKGANRISNRQDAENLVNEYKEINAKYDTELAQLEKEAQREAMASNLKRLAPEVEITPEDTKETIADKIKKIGQEIIDKNKKKLEDKKNDPFTPKQMGGPLSDEQVMIFFGEILIKIADGMISLEKALNELREHFKKSNLSTDEKMMLEKKLESRTKAFFKKVKDIDTSSKYTDAEQEEMIDEARKDLLSSAENHSFIIDDRFDALKKKVLYIYANIPGFKSNEQIEQMLVEIANKKESFLKDIDKSIKNLYEEGSKENNVKKINLAKRLNDKSDEELRRLFTVFGSTKYQPYVQFDNASKNIILSNINYEEALKDIVRQRLNAFTAEQFKKLRAQYNNPRITKEQLFEFLNRATGLTNSHWESYLVSPSFKGNKKAAFKRLWDNALLGNNKPGTAFSVSTKEEFYTRLTTSIKGEGSVINTIRRGSLLPIKLSTPINTKFKNVGWNQKSSGEFFSHLTNMLNRVKDDDYNESNNYYSSNDWVKEMRKSDKPIMVLLDGIYNKETDKKATTDILWGNDIRKTLTKFYDSNELGPDMYLQNVGQFGDKEKMAFVPAKRYKTLAEAKEKYTSVLAHNGFTEEEIKEAIDLLAQDANAFVTTSGTPSDKLLFAFNYAINFNEINDFINGKQIQYKKGEKQAYIDIFKRNGSTYSPGIVLDKYVEGGVGESHKVVVINKPITSVQDKTDFALADGAEFITREFSNQIEKSSGGMFGNIIKAITSFTNKDGNRFLVKTSAIVIDDLVKAFPDHEVYNAIYRLMKDNNIQRVVTQDGAKYKGNSETLNLFEENSYKPVAYKFDEESHINNIKTENYLVQQDLVNDSKFEEGSTPIQRIKNMMIHKLSKEITSMYNAIGTERINELIDKINNYTPEQFKTFLLKELKYTNDDIARLAEAMDEESVESTDKDHVKSLLINDVSKKHPHVYNWLKKFLANIVTKQALGRITNKNLFVESAYIPGKGFELRDLREVNGKMLMPEVAISATSKLRLPKTYTTKEEALSAASKLADMKDLDGNVREWEIEKTKDGYVVPGEYVLITRIPADNMHSHTLARVKYHLPEGVKNVIITNNESQYIAGSDFDGDQRTVETLFKTDGGKAIEEGRYGIANKAFRMDIEWFYDASNKTDALSAINTDYFNKYLKELPKEPKRNNDSPATFINSRTNNKVGLDVVGMMANMQAIRDFLVAHNVVLKFKDEGKKVSFPKLTLINGNIKFDGNTQLLAFKKGSKLKDAIGNLTNLALDNVKDPKIERLGLNEVTVKMFVNAMALDVDEESVIAFFNHPTVKDYVARVRKTNEVNNTENRFGIIKSMVLDYVQVEPKNWYKQLPSIEEFSDSDINDDESLKILSLIRYLDGLSKDTDKIHNVIRNNEKAKQTWADYKTGRDAMRQVMFNELKNLDTSEFKDSEFIKIGQKSLEVSKNFINKEAVETTKLGDDLLAQIQTDLKSNRDMSRNQYEDFSRALNAILLSNTTNRSEKFKDWAPKFIKQFEAYKEQGKFSSITSGLEINTKNGVKYIAIGIDLRNITDENDERIEDIKKQFKRFYNSDKADEREFAQNLIDYNIFQYQLSSSKPKGSYSSFFPIEVHKDIGLRMEEQFDKMNDEKFIAQNIQAIKDSIIANNPSLNPNVDKFDVNANKPVRNPIYEPLIKDTHVLVMPKKYFDDLVAGKEEFKVGTLATSPNVEVAEKLKEGDFVNITSDGKSIKRQIKTIVKPKDKDDYIIIKLEKNNDKAPQQQKQSIKPDAKKISDIVNRLQKAIPKAKVIYDSSIQAAGQVDADGKTVRINPVFAGSDTPIHEFAHILIDAIGGVNSPIVKKGIEQLRNTDLWKEIEARYPELDENQLAKEVLSEAIGREGKDIFEKEQQQSAFKSWLSALYFKIKSVLGIEKNIAKKLAMELLSNSDLGISPVESNIIQQQKVSNESEKEDKAFLKFLRGDNTEEIDETPQQRKQREIETMRSLVIGKWEDYAAMIESKRGGSYDKASIGKLETLRKKYLNTQDDVEKAKIKSEIEGILDQQKEYKKAYEQYLEDVDAVLDRYAKTDLKGLNRDDLVQLYAEMKAMDVLAAEPVLNEIYNNLINTLTDKGKRLLKEKYPNLNFEANSRKDIKLIEVYTKALSDFTEEHPEMQELAREYSRVYGNAIEEKNKWIQEINNAEKKVINEYNKQHGIKEKVKGFADPFEDNSVYFKFLMSHGTVITKHHAEYKRLTDAQREFVDLYHKVKLIYKDYSGRYAFGKDGLIKVEQTFPEFYKANEFSLLESYMHFTSQVPQIIDGVMMEYTNVNGKKEYLRFAEIKQRIIEAKSKGLLLQAKGVYELTKYKAKAKKLVEEKRHEGQPVGSYDNETYGSYDIKQGKIKSRFSKSYGDRAFSGDHGRALREFTKDMIFIKHMQDVVPMVEALEFANSVSGYNNKNLKQFLDIWKRGKLLKETIQPFGSGPDKYLRFLRQLAHYRIMAFNIPASGFNLLIGKYNQFRGQNLKDMARGEMRYLKEFDKAQNIMKHFQAISFEIDENPKAHIGRFFNMAAFGLTKLGENYIQLPAVIGQMTDEEWNMLDDKGNLKEKDPLKRIENKKYLNKKISEYKKNVADIQGKYSDEEKRNFSFFEIGRVAGQFKIWMLDTYKDRFASKYINMYGIEKQGTLNYLMSEGLKDILRVIKDKKEWEKIKSDKLKYELFTRNLRSMMAITALFALWLGTSDDDDDKELAGLLSKALKDMSFVLNTETYNITLPALVVISDAAKMIKAVVTIDQYKTKGKEHEIGDWKAVDQAAKLMPYNRMIKIADYIDLEEE